MKRFWFDVRIDGKMKCVIVQADDWDEAVSFIKNEEDSAQYTGMRLEGWKFVKEEIGKSKRGKGIFLRGAHGDEF